MDSYDTPQTVAAALARHAPRRVTRLLDPAVGRGVLVEAVSPSIAAGAGKALCIDVDDGVLSQCKERLRRCRGISAEYLNADFLEWKAAGLFFDCVIMNPPFGGKKQQEVSLDLARLPLKCGAPKVAPLEAAFILKAIELLEPGGRLLAVVPSSVILGQRSTWLRRYLCDNGRVTYIHELPQFTFSDLESRVYLLVFDKRGQSNTVTLLNHDVRRPFSMRVMRSMLDSELRLDFGFCSSSASLKQVMSRTTELNWAKLGTCARIFRGRGDSPHELERSIHTTDYSAKNWDFSKAPGNIARDRSERGLRRGDLLMKRVGRNCSYTLRANQALQDKQCSDCVFIVRPSKQIPSVRLLLAVRVLLESKIGPMLIERGSGASYITESALKSLLIPLGLPKQNVSLYRRYRQAVYQQNTERIRAIEREFRHHMGLADSGPLP
jgi:hypothetical protein